MVVITGPIMTMPGFRRSLQQSRLMWWMERLQACFNGIEDTVSIEGGGVEINI